MANAYTLVQALKAAGKNLTRQDLVNAINTNGAKWTGPGLVPFRYTTSDHGGFCGAEMGKITGRQDRPLRRAAHDHAGRRFGNHAVSRHSASAAGKRDSVELRSEGPRLRHVRRLARAADRTGSGASAADPGTSASAGAAGDGSRCVPVR